MCFKIDQQRDIELFLPSECGKVLAFLEEAESPSQEGQVSLLSWHYHFVTEKWYILLVEKKADS